MPMMEELPLPETLARQRGTTTQQMRHAKPGSIFVWCNHALDYPRELARYLDRDDLRVVGPDWLLVADNLRGMRVPIEIDHAGLLTLKRRHWEAIKQHGEWYERETNSR